MVTDDEIKRRRKEARAIIDQILNGTPDGGRVRPEVAASMRLMLARYPGQPDRALMEHMREGMNAAGIAFDAVLPEDNDTADD